MTQVIQYAGGTFDVVTPEGAAAMGVPTSGSMNPRRQTRRPRQ